MEIKLKRFIACLVTMLVVVVLFSCKHDADSTGQQEVDSSGQQGALPAPTNVAVMAHESKANTVTVTWETGADVARYYWIYYSTTNSTTGLEEPLEKAISGLYVDEGTGSYDIVLNQSETYYFWVRAADGYDLESPASAFSAAVSYQFTLKELAVPANVTVTAHADKLNTVTVTWQTGADVATYYWIYYSTTNDTASLTTPQERKYSSSLWEGTGTCDIVLDKSGTYYFWVRAANGYDTKSPASDFSMVASHQFTLKELTAPTNIKAEKLESVSYPGIELSWDTTKAPYYHIYWSESNDSSTAKKLASTSTNSDTIYENVSDLKKGTTYYFWVKSANGFSPADSDSDFSTVASFTYN